MFAGAVGGARDHWLELIGPVESLPIWNAVQSNWRITPIATGDELSAINAAAELLRAQQLYVTLMSMDPQFQDLETTIIAGGRSIPVRISRHALHAIWGYGVGPQTARAIFDENRPLFEEIIADKLQAGDILHGVVAITDDDLDM